MRIISRKRLREFAERRPDATDALEQWYRLVRAAEWKSLPEVRRVYPHADPVTVATGNTVTVFNVCGNKYRLIVAIHYNQQRVYILRIMTHAEYDKDSWKDSL
jgi:mRNA interferase HigB